MNKTILKNKYKKYKTPKNMLFAIIDTTILSKDLSNTELGFYILLKAKAGRRVIDGNQLRLSTTVGKLTTQINCDWVRNQ